MPSTDKRNDDALWADKKNPIVNAMGWRFRKSFRLLPGFRLNIGKRGITSATIGKRGISTSIGKRGIFQNLGIPGTGLSYRGKVGGSTQFGAFVGLAVVAMVLVGTIALCIGLAAIGRNSVPREDPSPAQLITASPTAAVSGLPDYGNTKNKLKPNYSPNSASRFSLYLLGARGGCYYVNSSGKKIYVNHGLCT